MALSLHLGYSNLWKVVLALRVLPLSFLASLTGVACAWGGCILTIMMALAHQVTFLKPAGDCLDCNAVVTVQYGYPLPWLGYTATAEFGLSRLGPLTVDFWAFAADFATYTLSLLGLMWASGLAISYLKRVDYLERLLLDILVIMTIVILIVLFWWPLIF